MSRVLDLIEKGRACDVERSETRVVRVSAEDIFMMLLVDRLRHCDVDTARLFIFGWCIEALACLKARRDG